MARDVPVEARGAPPGGALVIVGGGGTPDDVLGRAIGLAGGEDCRIAVLAQASKRPEAGDEAAAMFRAAGARQVRVLSLSGGTLEADRKYLETADLIWLTGGDQNRLMDRLTEAGVIDTIRRAQAGGAVVGGTSAGAAAMSEVMIRGSAELRAVRRGGTPLGEGLGLCTGVIVDQHFIRRQRFNRLLSAVLERPALVGIGIDEKTAIVMQRHQFEVMGEGGVMVIDARGARIDAGGEQATALLNGRDVRLHVLTGGGSFTLSE